MPWGLPAPFMLVCLLTVIHHLSLPTDLEPANRGELSSDGPYAVGARSELSSDGPYAVGARSELSSDGPYAVGVRSELSS